MQRRRSIFPLPLTVCAAVPSGDPSARPQRRALALNRRWTGAGLWSIAAALVAMNRAPRLAPPRLASAATSGSDCRASTALCPLSGPRRVASSPALCAVFVLLALPPPSACPPLPPSEFDQLVTDRWLRRLIRFKFAAAMPSTRGRHSRPLSADECPVSDSALPSQSTVSDVKVASLRGRCRCPVRLQRVKPERLSVASGMRRRGRKGPGVHTRPAMSAGAATTVSARGLNGLTTSPRPRARVSQCEAAADEPAVRCGLVCVGVAAVLVTAGHPQARESSRTCNGRRCGVGRWQKSQK